uniref:Uncharacterized protein n=1 Tax=Quercus lobata TaxID=97700 RepID=A0A7N2LI33_QUELO
MVGWGLSTLDATKSTKTLGSTTPPSDLCRCFSLAEIKAAGNNFDNVFIIGVRRFGNVYEDGDLYWSGTGLNYLHAGKAHDHSS